MRGGLGGAGAGAGACGALGGGAGSDVKQAPPPAVCLPHPHIPLAHTPTGSLWATRAVGGLVTSLPPLPRRDAGACAARQSPPGRAELQGYAQPAGGTACGGCGGALAGGCRPSPSPRRLRWHPAFLQYRGGAHARRPRPDRGPAAVRAGGGTLAAWRPRRRQPGERGGTRCPPSLPDCPGLRLLHLPHPPAHPPPYPASRACPFAAPPTPSRPPSTHTPHTHTHPPPRPPAASWSSRPRPSASSRRRTLGGARGLPGLPTPRWLLPPPTSRPASWPPPPPGAWQRSATFRPPAPGAAPCTPSCDRLQSTTRT